LNDGQEGRCVIGARGVVVVVVLGGDAVVHCGLSACGCNAENNGGESRQVETTYSVLDAYLDFELF
jgi:hypothetical protein